MRPRVRTIRASRIVRAKTQTPQQGPFRTPLRRRLAPPGLQARSFPAPSGHDALPSSQARPGTSTMWSLFATLSTPIRNHKGDRKPEKSHARNFGSGSRIRHRTRSWAVRHSIFGYPPGVRYSTFLRPEIDNFTREGRTPSRCLTQRPPQSPPLPAGWKTPGRGLSGPPSPSRCPSGHDSTRCDHEWP